MVSGDLESPAWEVPPPRENPDLVGHEAAERRLLEALSHGRLGHAWMISGPRGVGKATLAYRFARYLLAGGNGAAGEGAPRGLSLDPSHPVFRRVAAGSHGDLFTLQRGRDEKRNRLRTAIVVEDAWRMARFFSFTAGEGGWRIAVVDCVDELNRAAANALLKVLEEPPPQALMLLVAHAPGRSLATIRSRCHKLKLEPLDEAAVGELLGRYRPELDAGDRAAIARLSGGSAGRALALAAGGGLDLYRELVALLETLPGLDVAAAHALADRLSRANAEPDFRLFTALFEGWLARLIRAKAGAESAAIVPGEAALTARLAARGGLDQWFEVWDKMAGLVAGVDSINLDRKQVLLSAFTSLDRVGRG